MVKKIPEVIYSILDFTLSQLLTMNIDVDSFYIDQISASERMKTNKILKYIIKSYFPQSPQKCVSVIKNIAIDSAIEHETY